MTQKQQIFLLGISQRSGTNFLMKLLEKHPNIIKSSHPGEDFIIHNSNHLLKHVSETQNCWNTIWKGMDKDKYGKKYLDYISNALIDYLSPNTDIKEHQYCITKTPSVENIDNFFKLFPQSKLIILVRNGKDIIESGVKGFGWNYTNAMKMIRRRGELIIDFIKENDKNNKNFIVVKYEDLVEDTEKSIKKIFNQFKIDDSLFNYDLNDIPVYGSSFNKDEKDHVSWEPQKKNKEFTSLKRTKNWSYFMNLKYTFFCSNIDKYFNYK